MDRQIVQLNPLLSQKWEQKMQSGHRDRVMAARKQVNNNPPPIYKHMVYKPKKLQILSERYHEIEKNNRLLMQKMSKIIKGDEPFRKL